MLLLPACAGTDPGTLGADRLTAPLDGPAEVWADWDDVRAAAEVGLMAAECAVVKSSSSDDRVAFEVVTLMGDTGTLTTTRDPRASRDARGCEKITLAANVQGRDGPLRAARLVEGTRRRLTQLAGVDWAEIK